MEVLGLVSAIVGAIATVVAVYLAARLARKEALAAAAADKAELLAAIVAMAKSTCGAVCIFDRVINQPGALLKNDADKMERLRKRWKNWIPQRYTATIEDLGILKRRSSHPLVIGHVSTLRTRLAWLRDHLAPRYFAGKLTGGDAELLAEAAKDVVVAKDVLAGLR